MSAGEFPVYWIAGSLTERTWTLLSSGFRARRSAWPLENAEACKSTTKRRSNLSLDVQITLWRRFEGESLASFKFDSLLAPSYYVVWPIGKLIVPQATIRPPCCSLPVYTRSLSSFLSLTCRSRASACQLAIPF